MPNWCQNTLYLKHNDQAQLQKAADGFNGEGLFKAFLPTPEGEDWYEWNVENWGTKWDVSATDWTGPATVENNQLNLSFDSAWSPPITFYEHLESLGFIVDAFYYEAGMDFCGRWLDGEDDYYEGTENIPEEIDREFSISENKEMWAEEESE